MEPTEKAGTVLKLILRKSDKLRIKSEFEYVRNHGQKQACRGFLLVAAPSPDGKLKCGVICSRKYSTLAVRRNRARRLLWESFRLLKPQIAAGYLVLIPRRQMMNYRCQEVVKELERLLRQAGLLPSHADSSPQR